MNFVGRSQDVVFLVPYDFYKWQSSEPWLPFLVLVVHLCIAIVVAYTRLPQKVSLILFYRFVYLHLVVNTVRILWVSNGFIRLFVCVGLFVFMDHFASHTIHGFPILTTPPTIASNRCEMLNMLVWGLHQYAVLCFFPVILQVFHVFHLRQLGFLRLPRYFEEPYHFMSRFTKICFYTNAFFSLEVRHCIKILNTLPFDTSRSYIDVVNTALINAGWNYPVHVVIELHVKYMNTVWTFLGLAA